MPALKELRNIDWPESFAKRALLTSVRAGTGLPGHDA
jgi:hypothetical protein